MISIEELCGIPEFVETEEDKQLKRKANAEEDMRVFDLLPIEIRNLLNFSEVPLDSRTAAWIYKNSNYNIDETKRTIERIFHDFISKTIRRT